MRTVTRRWLHALFIVLAVLTAGCDTLSYYSQALGGQVELWRATRPLESVIADPQTPEVLRERLRLAERIRNFASRELALPDNGSYRGYADLHRPYVVWNVFAAEALSIVPKKWCFPIAGCVAYRGYFSKAGADAFAERLRLDGYDVFVGGVPAYSTLGYFDDPFLNTFIHYPPPELARLIFHELAHQVAYARDDSVFNESFAVAVEREGVRRWLRKHGTAAQSEAVERARQRRAQFNELVSRYRSRLEQVYAAAQSDAQKRAQKAAAFKELAEEYARLKASWNGYRGYDPWLGAGANNATLASVAVYAQKVPEFEALLARLDGDLGRFYTAVAGLARTAKTERDAALAKTTPAN